MADKMTSKLENPSIIEPEWENGDHREGWWACETLRNPQAGLVLSPVHSGCRVTPARSGPLSGTRWQRGQEDGFPGKVETTWAPCFWELFLCLSAFRESQTVLLQSLIFVIGQTRLTLRSPSSGVTGAVTFVFSQRGFESCVSTTFNMGDMLDLDLQAAVACHRSGQGRIRTRTYVCMYSSSANCCHEKELRLVIHQGKYSGTRLALQVLRWTPQVQRVRVHLCFLRGVLSESCLVKAGRRAISHGGSLGHRAPKEDIGWAPSSAWWSGTAF